MGVYRNILKLSLKNTWRQKYLWFFGLFSVLLVSNGPEYEVISRFLGGQDTFSQVKNFFGNDFVRNGLWNGLKELARKDPGNLAVITIVFLIILLLILFILWLAIVSQGAIIRNTALIASGKENNIKTGTLAGIKSFWPLLSLNILIKIIIALFSFIMIWLLDRIIFDGFGLARAAAYLAAFLIFIPSSIVASFAVKYGLAYAVIKEEGLVKSFRRGIKLFADNWLVSLEMSLLLFAINIVAFLAVVFLSLVLGIALLLMAKIAVAMFASKWLFLFSLVFAYFVLLFFIAFCGSFITVFQTSAWTNLFIMLIGRGAESKLARLFGRAKS